MSSAQRAFADEGKGDEAEAAVATPVPVSCVRWSTGVMTGVASAPLKNFVDEGEGG